MKKSFKRGTVGVFSVSESKVIAKFEKKVKTRIYTIFVDKNCAKKKYMCSEVCVPKTISPEIIC